MNVNAKLVIVVAMHPEEDPQNPGEHIAKLRVSPQWILNGVPQRCDDPAIVLSALRQAFDAILAGVVYNPPSVITPPMELVKGAH